VASSAASVRLALAGVTRAAKTRQRGVALARRSETAAAVFCVPPSPTTRLWAARRAPMSPIALAPHSRPRRGERWYLREGPRRAPHGPRGSSR